VPEATSLRSKGRSGRAGSRCPRPAPHCPAVRDGPSPPRREPSPRAGADEELDRIRRELRTRRRERAMGSMPHWTRWLLSGGHRPAPGPRAVPPHPHPGSPPERLLPRVEGREPACHRVQPQTRRPRRTGRAELPTSRAKEFAPRPPLIGTRPSPEGPGASTVQESPWIRQYRVPASWDWRRGHPCCGTCCTANAD